MNPLSVSELRGALTEVARRLERRGVQARLYVAGGAAMAFAHNADRLTRDIDAAISQGHGALMEEVRAVARSRGWPTTWLNEQATAYMPPTEDRHSEVVFDHPALVVAVASPGHLLAMKARSARDSDIADMAILLRRTGYPTAEAVDNLVTTVFPGEHLNERQQRWLEDVITSTYPTPPSPTSPDAGFPHQPGRRLQPLTLDPPL